MSWVTSTKRDMSSVLSVQCVDCLSCGVSAVSCKRIKTKTLCYDTNHKSC